MGHSSFYREGVFELISIYVNFNSNCFSRNCFFITSLIIALPQRSQLRLTEQIKYGIVYMCERIKYFKINYCVLFSCKLRFTILTSTNGVYVGALYWLSIVTTEETVKKRIQGITKRRKLLIEFQSLFYWDFVSIKVEVISVTWKSNVLLRELDLTKSLEGFAPNLLPRNVLLYLTSNTSL